MNPSEFEQCYLRFYSYVYGVCYRYFHEAAEAEDAAMESFAKAYVALDSFEKGQPFQGWIGTIAKRTCLDRLRRIKREQTNIQAYINEELGTPVEVMDPEVGVPDTIERKALNAIIEQAMGKLTDEERAIIILRYVEGLSRREAAQNRGITDGRLRWIEQVALVRLRAEFEKNGLDFFALMGNSP